MAEAREHRRVLQVQINEVDVLRRSRANERSSCNIHKSRHQLPAHPRDVSMMIDHSSFDCAASVEE